MTSRFVPSREESRSCILPNRGEHGAAGRTYTILQTIAEEEKRGRVMSYYTMAFVGMAPFGSLLAGGIAARMGAPNTLLISGICCVGGAAWFGLHLQELRKAVRPRYIELGILPEMAAGIQTASALRTPPEE